jgi:hypothetical protein
MIIVDCEIVLHLPLSSAPSRLGQTPPLQIIAEQSSDGKGFWGGSLLHNIAWNASHLGGEVSPRSDSLPPGERAP